MTEAITQSPMNPYLTQYLGAWAIMDSAADLLRERASKIDWNAHMTRQAEAREASDGSRPSMYRYSVTPEGIAMMQVSGTLMKRESSWTDSTSTVMLQRTIRDAVANDRVRGIMLRVDSPGGTVNGTEELGTTIAEAAAKKPVGVYADGLLCSAAYWMGSQAGFISSNETSVIGSIGVLIAVYDQSAQFSKEGIKVHVIRSAEAKGAGVVGSEVTPKQLAEWQRMIDATHTVFVKAVASGRGITTEAAAKLADARVHVGAEAKSIGMIDHVESFDAAVTRLLSAAPKSKSKASMSASAEDVINDTTSEAAAGDVPLLAGADDESSTGQSSPEKGSDMGQTSTTAPAAPAPEQPKAATAAEIKAACPGASSDFVLDCVENGKTLAESKDAFIGWQRAQITSRDESIENLNADHKSAIEAKDATIKTLTEERDAARTAAKNAGGLVETAATEQNKSTPEDKLDPKAQAKQEWESNHANCRANFISEKAYVGYRSAELAGRIKGKK